MDVAGITPFNLTQLPEHVLSQILSYLSYSEISDCRRVSQTFNRICWRMLNNAFSRVDRFHSQIQRSVKQQLPRRESERRNHQLSRHSDILSAVETRLSLLSMTYSKYIELDLCCFIPGKVLDELYRILCLLQQTDRQPPRAHEFLQELRDISSMAMEHFEEHVTPGLKPHIPPGTSPFYLPPSVSPSSSEAGTPSSSFGSPSPWVSTPQMTVTPVRIPGVRQDLIRLQQQSRVQNSGLLALKKEQHEQKSKISEQRRLIAEQERKLQEQARLITELTGHIQALEKNMELVAQQLAGVTGQQVILSNVPQLPKIRLTGDGESREKGDGTESPDSAVEASTISNSPLSDTPGSSLPGESCRDVNSELDRAEAVLSGQKSVVGDIFDGMLCKSNSDLATGKTLARNKGKSRKRSTQEDASGREEVSKRRRR